MITSIALEILYVDILDTGSYNETGTVNTWGLSGIWFSLAAIQINLLSHCKIGSFSITRDHQNQATSGSVMLQIQASSWDSSIKSWGTQRPKHQKDLIHCSCIRASSFMLVLQSWKAAKTSKRHDPSFFFQEFMFQTCIAVIKTSQELRMLSR